MSLSMNKLAANIVKEIIDREKELNVVTKKIGRATIVDAGLKTRSSFEAGILISKICLGGLA
ncbi:MAG: methenyltetrahydromethanopterin cyclohydrolase, partial [Thermoprotei archaeon]